MGQLAVFAPKLQGAADERPAQQGYDQDEDQHAHLEKGGKLHVQPEEIVVCQLRQGK